jgi:hypothetical protein
MKNSLPALVAFCVLVSSCAASAAPAPAAAPPGRLQRPIDADTPPDPAPAAPRRGSTVMVPPLIADTDTGPLPPMRVLRLPVQAGKVSNMVATNIVENSKAWIAEGDKYYSLCVPDGVKVACAPIVARATMQDIEVGAYADANGVAKVTFRIARDTRRQAKPLIASMRYFLARISLQAAHFERKAGNAARSKSPPSGDSATPAMIDDGGGSCGFDDQGEYDCSGGDGGWDGAGYDNDSYDWGGDESGAEGSGDDPNGPAIPSFPSGSDNGDADPCMDAGGNNVCQQVVITGQLPDAPQEMAMPVCVVTPWVVGCTRSPPPVVGGDPFDELPRGPRPWLPQGACNIWSVLCSAGQTPADEPPPVAPQDKRRAARMKCLREANAALTACHQLRAMVDDAFFETCKRNALDQGRECGTTAMDR